MTDFIQVAVSCGNCEEAERIGDDLVGRRLAGCVQIVGPVRSVYRWQGQVEQADEWLCLVKTSRERYAAVEAAIRELHSYDCPEVIATPIVAGAEAYLQWLAAQIADSPDSPATG